MIAPTFESLATKHAKPGRVAFCKVDVDAQGDVARQYGVRAMPTFLVLRAGAVVDTIQGANPPALIAAVEKAVKLAAGPGGAAGAAFSGTGHRLGGSGVGGSAPAARGAASVARPFSWSLSGFLEALIGFFGLYFWSLFSLDPYKAAENSPFNKNRPPPPRTGGTRPAGRPGFKTLSDLGAS
ncbi:uncharacterized protein THITE_68045 [Thermothielavioides terrestris NRRL 8126]|uniref:Thioredoxin domain-containing protein n=1 Tax=Thermothielavioides terrestris (strain ATCC 38088 / NRRL 8126) TaxID=578455 RepID=G2R0E5_THETT|nr:uncharacterized protein THITE_68045 [Thermothielavioides terrestris NRRL 8126]AEO65610.1 hypothetical protein THITE_68045 [Thermothielavioides terrestris NRRL 8126]